MVAIITVAVVDVFAAVDGWATMVDCVAVTVEVVVKMWVVVRWQFTIGSGH